MPKCYPSRDAHTQITTKTFLQLLQIVVICAVIKKHFRNSELSVQVRQTLHHSCISIMHFRISLQVQQTLDHWSTNSTPLLHLHKAFSKKLAMPRLPSGGLQIIHHSFISTNCRYLCSNDKAFSKFEIQFTGSTNSPCITIMHFRSYYLCSH